MLQFIVSLFTAISNIVLGLFVFFKNRKSATNILLFFLTIIIASWTITNYFSLNSPTPEFTLFWIRVVMFLVSPLGPVIFLLIHTFPRIELQIKKQWLIAIILLTVTTAMLAISPYMFTGIEIKQGNIAPVPGPGI